MEIKLEDITPMDQMFKEEDRMFVALDLSGNPLIITKGEYETGSHIGLCLNIESIHGNCYESSCDTLFDFIYTSLQLNWRIATFYDEDWRGALRWLIENAK